MVNINAGDDTEVMTRQQSNSNQSDQFAKPKGEMTRTAIKEVLANKLKTAKAIFNRLRDNYDPINMLNYEVTDHHLEGEPEHVIQESHWDNIIAKAR